MSAAKNDAVEAVAAATGHSVETVVSRGTSFCRRNPVAPREAFDLAQAPAPDDLDQTLELRDLAAEAAAHGHDPDALDAKLRREVAALPAREMSAFVRRDPVADGVQLVGLAGGRTAILTPVLSVEDADEIEPAMRAAAFAYAEALMRRAA